MEITLNLKPEQLEVIEILLQNKYKLLKSDLTKELDPLKVYQSICLEALNRVRSALYVLQEETVSTPIKKRLSAPQERNSISDAKKLKLNTLETMLASI